MGTNICLGSLPRRHIVQDHRDWLFRRIDDRQAHAEDHERHNSDWILATNACKHETENHRKLDHGDLVVRLGLHDGDWSNGVSSFGRQAGFQWSPRRFELFRKFDALLVNDEKLGVLLDKRGSLELPVDRLVNLGVAVIDFLFNWISVGRRHVDKLEIVVATLWLFLLAWVVGACVQETVASESNGRTATGVPGLGPTAAAKAT